MNPALGGVLEFGELAAADELVDLAKGDNCPLYDAYGGTRLVAKAIGLWHFRVGAQLHHINGDRSRSVAENLTEFCGNCHTMGKKGKFDKLIWLFGRECLSAIFIRGWDRSQKLNQESRWGLSMCQASKITNHFGAQKTSRIILPETIGSDAKLYNYVEYLVKKLADCMKSDFIRRT